MPKNRQQSATLGRKTILHLYALLGLSQNATEQEIAQALAEAEQNRKISAENAKFVREFLLDADKRAEYDNKLHTETQTKINPCFGFLERIYRWVITRRYDWSDVIFMVAIILAVSWSWYYDTGSVDRNYGSPQVLLDNGKNEFYVQVNVSKPRGLELSKVVHIKHGKEKFRCHCTKYICHYNVVEWKLGFGFVEKYPLSKAVVSIALGKTQNDFLRRGPRYCEIHSLKFKNRADVLSLAARSRLGPAEGISDEEYLRELWIDESSK